MNFSSMDYFTVLAQERNFTRAAERLHITQQSLSSHIAGMEKELGSQLLLRLSINGVGACVCPQNIIPSVLTPEQLDSIWVFPLGTEAASRIQFGYQKQSYQWSVIERFIACAKAVVEMV